MIDNRVRKQGYNIGGEENDCLLLNENGWVFAPYHKMWIKKLDNIKYIGCITLLFEKWGFYIWLWRNILVTILCEYLENKL